MKLMEVVKHMFLFKNDEAGLETKIKRIIEVSTLLNGRNILEFFEMFKRKIKLCDIPHR